jgi:hypothetical protein
MRRKTTALVPIVMDLILVFMCFVVCLGLEANALAPVAEIIVEIGLVAILESNVVKELIVFIGEWIKVFLAIVSVIKPAKVCGMLIVDRMSKFRFAVCFCVKWREG